LERGGPFGVEGVSMDVEKTISFVTSCRREPSSCGWVSLAVQWFQSLKSLISIIPVKILKNINCKFHQKGIIKILIIIIRISKKWMKITEKIKINPISNYFPHII
jgi:hypothetical protein